MKLKKITKMLDMLQSINPDQIDGRVCCGMLERCVQAGIDWPFERPIVLEYHYRHIEGWHIKVMSSLASGKPDNEAVLLFRLKYCPFCGAKLVSGEDDPIS